MKWHKPRESGIENTVVVLAESLGGFAWKLNPAWVKGIPDRMVLLPKGRVIFVETKMETGRESPRQLWIHDRLRALGFRVEVPRSSDEVRAMFAPFIAEQACEKR